MSDSEIRTKFTSQADKSGIDEFKRSLGDMDSDINGIQKSADNVSVSMDKAFGSRERRELGRFIFRDIATEALTASTGISNVKGASEAAYIGISILGKGIVGLTSVFGVVALAASGVVLIYQKLKGASEETTETVNKFYASNIETRESLTQLVNETGKYINLSKSERDAILQRTGALKDELVQKAKKLQIEAQEQQSQTTLKIGAIEAKQSQNNLTKSQYDALSTYSTYQLRSSNLDKIKKELIDQQTEAYKKEAAAVNLLNEMDKKESGNKDKSDKSEYYAKLDEAILNTRLRQIEASNQYSEALTIQHQIEARINEDEKDYAQALADGDKKKIESVQKRIALDKQELSSATSTADKIKSGIQKNANAISKINTDVENYFTASNGKILFNARSMMAEEIKSFAAMVAQKLEWKAAEYLLSGQYAKAALAEAGALAIRAGAGAAAAAIEAGGQSSSSTSGGTASTSDGSTSSASSSNTTASQGTTLTINVSAMHVGSTASLAKFLGDVINEGVSQNNVKIKATQIVGRGGAFVTG